MAGITRAFPCVWSWSLYDGLIPGYVLAGANAKCTGLHGSLTLRIQLLARVAGAASWSTVHVKTARWHNLAPNHALEVRQRCVLERVRAVITWTLRDGAGAVSARHIVRSGSVSVAPGCKIILK